MALGAAASDESRVECTNTGAAGGGFLVSNANILGFDWWSMEWDGSRVGVHVVALDRVPTSQLPI